VVQTAATTLLAVTTDLLEAMAVSPLNYQLGGAIRSVRRARTRPVETPVRPLDKLTKPHIGDPDPAPGR
jgi:hypothetical protein